MSCGFRQAPGWFLRPSLRSCTRNPQLRLNRVSRCPLHNDSRNRASNIWMPTKKHLKIVDGTVDGDDWLVRGNFYSKAYSGVYHMMPLGLRVQEKIEKLIDRHMQSVGASKTSLSSLSAAALWEKTGRLNPNSEVFRVADRRDSGFILAPTHEEEITQLVGSIAASYRSLPVRLYQISRKYRDEPRPRQGLLRAREFIMKDLYTFDHSPETALETYELVKNVYKKLFEELSVPILTATADSGNMGGNLSHEFHIPSVKGEDTVVTCSSCDNVYNEEVSSGILPNSNHPETADAPGFDVDGAASEGTTVSTGLWTGISRDRTTIVRAWHPKFTLPKDSDNPIHRSVNIHAIKAIAQAAGVDLLTSSENPLGEWGRHYKLSKEQASAKGLPTPRPKVVDIYDSLVRAYDRPPHKLLHIGPDEADFTRLDKFPGTESKLSILKAGEGDRCLSCKSGTLTPHTTVELGHTFHLGTRYTEPLDASILDANNKPIPMQMGCHGIGVSRMIAAVADVLADNKGLNWPKAIAPYQVVIIPSDFTSPDADRIHDLLNSTTEEAVNQRRTHEPMDILIDDRVGSFGAKMKDADLIGYPVIIVIGRAWKESQNVEVQVRRLGIKQEMALDELAPFVRESLARL